MEVDIPDTPPLALPLALPVDVTWSFAKAQVLVCELHTTPSGANTGVVWCGAQC